MVFASFIFLFWFVPIALPFYFAAPVRLRNVALILCSFAFYGWWRPQYVLLMLLSVAIDYWAARRMRDGGELDDEAEAADRPRRRRWLLVSVVANLSLLAWFKYSNLAVATWNDATPWPVEWEEIILPIGISFFTFQSMSYTIDVYRGDVKPTRSFLDLLCFVSMFPQLVAGPIVRYRDIQSYLTKRVTSLRMLSDGVFLFALGFSKKVLIADSVGPLVDHVYAGSDPGLIAAWAGAFGYAIQIYFDFSGYSDMALGLGLILGFKFPENFRSPYHSRSITEIWQRWHISLSLWLRDYLYIPLGGNRRGEVRAQFNIFATMTLCGIWHGATWTYLVWGMWQGLVQLVERRLGKNEPYHFLPVPMQLAWTFVLWSFGLVMVRSLNMGKLSEMLSGMFGMRGIGSLPTDMGQQLPLALGAAVLGLVIVHTVPRSYVLVQRCHPLVMLGAIFVFVLSMCQVMASDFIPFIYYQF